MPRNKSVVSGNDTPLRKRAASQRPARTPANSFETITVRDISEPEDSTHSVSDDEFEVEAIVGHRFNDDSVLEYKVRWTGYNETTFEPESNLAHLGSILQRYHASIGGPPSQSRPSKRSKIRVESSTLPSRLRVEPRDVKTQSQPRPRTRANFPGDNWDKHVKEIVTLERVIENGVPKISGYVVFKDAKYDKCKTSLALLRKRCPHRLLDYFEARVQFEDNFAAVDDNDVME